MAGEVLGAHIPWSQLNAYLDFVFDMGLTPEIALKASDLEGLDPAQVTRLAERINASGQRPTVHAPFFDLNPGAIDPLVREATAQRLSQSLAVAISLNARLMVVHPGFDHWRYPGMEHIWAENAHSFFRDLLNQDAEGKTCIALENIYERSPDTLLSLVDEIDSARLGHCFDIGHWNLFGRIPLETWLSQIGPRLFHLHLHDNTGTGDDHLPVGDGNIDFDQLFSLVSAFEPGPSMTLEAHRPEDLVRSCQNVSSKLHTALPEVGP